MGVALQSLEGVRPVFSNRYRALQIRDFSALTPTVRPISRRLAASIVSVCLGHLTRQKQFGRWRDTHVVGMKAA
jgi:hypothetical protein